MASDSWFRMYNTAVDHPKVMMLSDSHFRAWVRLMSLASKMGGTIPPDLPLIAQTLRKTTGKAADILQVLQSAVLLDPVDSGWCPHNWNEKQFKSDVSTDRVRAFRERSRNVSGTDHKQKTETEAETEKKISPRAMRAEFDEKFWPVCPKKVAKGAAFKAFTKARRATECDTIVAGMARYGASRAGQDAQFTSHPATWLNAEQWLDESLGASDAPKLRLVSSETEALEQENLKKLGVI